MDEFKGIHQKKTENSLIIIFRGSAITLGGAAVGILLNFFFKMIAARSFGPADYGLLSLVMAVMVVSANISGLGLNQSVARYIAFYKEKSQKKEQGYIISFGLRLSLLASLAVSLGIVIFSGWISKFFRETNELASLLVLFSIMIPFEVIFDYLIGVLRGQRNIRMMVLCNDVILWIARLSILGVILIFRLEVKWMVLSYLSSYIIGLTVMYFYQTLNKQNAGQIFIRASGYSDSVLRKNFILYSLPLAFSTMTVMFRKRFDVIFIGFFLSVSQVGLYNIALPLAMLLPIFLFSINRLTMPMVTELFSSESEAEMRFIYITVSKWALTATLPLFFILFFFSRNLINIFFGTEYIGAASALRILTVGYFINSVCGSFGEYLQSYGKTGTILVISLLGTSVNITLMLILIPFKGIEGAAYAMSISLIFMALYGSVYIFYFKRLIPFTKQYFFILMAGLLIFSTLYSINQTNKEFLNYQYTFMMLILALLIYFAVVYKYCTNQTDRLILSKIRKRAAF